MLALRSLFFREKATVPFSATVAGFSVISKWTWEAFLIMYREVILYAPWVGEDNNVFFQRIYKKLYIHDIF